MTGKRKGWLAAGAVLMGVMIYSMCGRKEPGYQGKKLSQWLATTLYWDGAEWKGAPDAQFREAMKAMGTNALPHLTRMVTKKDYPFTQWMYQRVGNVQNPTLNRAGVTGPLLSRRRAVHGFEVLQSQGTNAIPAILEGGVTAEMVEALNAIGSEGLPIVLKTMERGDDGVKFAGIFGLQAAAYDREKVVDTWTRYQDAESPRLRWAVAAMMSTAPKYYSNIVSKTLTQLAADKDGEVTAMAKRSSQRFAWRTWSLEENILVP